MFVLVGGWPGSGKTTLARAVASEMGVPLLAKDAIKEALADALGQPAGVTESQRLGSAAVLALLRVARDCPSAVLDSTWFDYARPLAAALPGTVVEVLCVVPVEVARSRYYARAAVRHQAHLDFERDEKELWGRPPSLPGVGQRVEVDTTAPVDVTAVVAAILRAAARA